MRLMEAAELYVTLNVYQPDTANTIIRIARLFDERSGISNMNEIDYQAIKLFRDETMRVAKNVTYNGYLRYLKLLNQWLLKEGMIERNWFESVKYAPIPEAPPKIIEPEDFHQILLFLKSPKNMLKPAWFWLIVVRFLYYTGVRRRQIVAIELQDVDLANRVLTCSYRSSKNLREWEIPIADELVTDIQYLIRRSADVLGRPLRPEDKLFNVCRFYSRYKPHPKYPDQMTREQITGFMRRLSKNSDIKIGAHRIRHTTATDLCNPADCKRNPDIFAVQKLLGHAQLSTTRIYVKTKITQLRRQVNELYLPK